MSICSKKGFINLFIWKISPQLYEKNLHLSNCRVWETHKTNSQTHKLAKHCHLRNNEKGTRWSAYLRHVMPDPREHIGSNTFLKYAIQYNIIFGPISQRWRITLKIKQFSYPDPDPDSDLHQNRINSSLRHTQPVHQVSSESVHNLLRYHAILLRIWKPCAHRQTAVPVA